MGYRASVKGTLSAEGSELDRVQGVLTHRGIDFTADGQAITIDHFDRNMNPGDKRFRKAFDELSKILHESQVLTVWDEFEGEHEVAVGSGRVKKEMGINIWSHNDSPPTPEQILMVLRQRGLAVRLTRVKGRRGGARHFEFQPSTGGPSVRIVVKRRFWDSFDLLSVPNVCEDLCSRYGLSPEELRDKLYSSKFGFEIRNPAMGSEDTDELYEVLLDVLENLSCGIRTTVG